MNFRYPISVIPAKAGIQRLTPMTLDFRSVSNMRGSDDTFEYRTMKKATPPCAP